MEVHSCTKQTWIYRIRKTT